MRFDVVTFLRLAVRAYLPRGKALGRPTPWRLLVMTGFLPAFFLLQVVHQIGFWLDDLFFRGYRRVPVRAPVFVVGVPRSGTTFLHRVLAQDTDTFTTFTLWELIFAPSIAERRVLMALARLDRLVGRPLGRLAGFVERRFLQGLDDIHGTSLDSPEEDYLCLLPRFGCFLLVLPFPFAEEIWNLAWFDERVPAGRRARLLAHYRECVQRHLYVHGPEKTLLSKNPSFSPMIESLREAFPDARVVACARNPLKAIPSLLSSMESGARTFGIDTRGGEFHRRFVEVMKFYYRHLLERLPQWPEKQHAFAPLERLKGDVAGQVADIYARFGLELRAEFRQALAAEGEQSRRYKSAHRYTLEQFGLTERGLAEDLRFVFERFDYPLPDGEDRGSGVRGRGSGVGDPGSGFRV